MNNMKILIVEDESLVALELEMTLKGFGYDVVGYATTSKMAKDYVDTNNIDLILMDINLKEAIDGIDLYQSFNKNIPVIYLTAYKDEKTISKAVATNPLGYLVKPINSDELNALLKLAVYKMKNESTSKNKNNFLDIGEKYFFDEYEDKLFYQETFIPLSQNELKLLKLLIESKGQVVSFKTIEDEIWSNKVVSNSSLRTLIYRLRSKLEYKLIENEFKYGIKL
ncbi:MAG: response regulator [Sulfurimonadaceae bacterium]